MEEGVFLGPPALPVAPHPSMAPPPGKRTWFLKQFPVFLTGQFRAIGWTPEWIDISRVFGLEYTRM